MRILVTINQSQPELLNELRKLEPRHRAERIRTLAFLGLKSHNKYNASAVTPTVAQTNDKDSDMKQSANSALQEALNQGLKNLSNL